MPLQLHIAVFGGFLALYGTVALNLCARCCAGRGRFRPRDMTRFQQSLLWIGTILTVSGITIIKLSQPLTT
jgi:hypothetical protein